MNKPYRPRLPEVIAMLDAMPGTDRELQLVSGHDLLWTQQKLSALLNRGVITRRHGVYSKIADFEPSTTLKILDALRTSGPLTRKDVAALGVADRTVCGILAQLERKGRIEVDSTVRPFRFSLVRGLERLAAYEANR
jgi:hypothetical protein